MNTAFVIPHMGRSAFLRQTLQSIAEQESYAGDIEVVVVTKEAFLDVGPNLDTVAGAAIPIRVLNVGPDLTISSQRNLGARQCGGDHLAFVDADVLLARDWLETMQRQLYATAGRVIVSAVQRCSSAPTMLEVIRTDQTNVHVDVDLQHMPGRNLFMRRALFEATDGFPEHLTTCEDYCFTGRAAAFGSLHYSSRSGYVHLGEDKFLAPMFVKEIWRGASNLHSIAGRPVGWDELPSFLVPVWVTLAILASSASLLAGAGVSLALSLLCFVVPAILFSFRLKHRTRSSAGMLHLILFYSVYFTARGLGMLVGLAKALGHVGARASGGNR